MHSLNLTIYFCKLILRHVIFLSVSSYYMYLVSRNIENMAQRVEMLYTPFLMVDMSQ